MQYTICKDSADQSAIINMLSCIYVYVFVCLHLYLVLDVCVHMCVYMCLYSLTLHTLVFPGSIFPSASTVIMDLSLIYASAFGLESRTLQIL